MQYQDMDDSKLWDLLLKEDSEALKVIYYRNYDLLLNYGRKICRNEELVKDCIHDIFLKIFGNKNLSNVNQIRPYLLRSLRNNITEELSKKGNANQVDFDIVLLTLFYADNDAAESDDDALKKSGHLKKAMQKLNENQRQIIYLRYVKDLNFKEIAELLDIRVQSAMNLASRSLTKLRNILTNNNNKTE